MSDRYRFEESPQGQDFQGGAPLSPEGVRAADHYLLAQLGQRAREIVWESLKMLQEGTPRSGIDHWEARELFHAVRSLGLLDEKGGQP